MAGWFLQFKDYHQDEEDEQQIDRRIGWVGKIADAKAACTTSATRGLKPISTTRLRPSTPS